MVLCALFAAGCDQGNPAVDPSHGPNLHVVATYPASGQGTECGPSDGGVEAGSPASCGVPINAAIELRLDRYLRPSTAVRQSIHVYSGDKDNSPCRFSGRVPLARSGHALAYDAARQHTVLFGGRNTTELSDTWRWDGGSWGPLAATGPSARDQHAMAYDAARQQVVLFGGYDGTSARFDTWEWDGAKWFQIVTSGPSGRSGHAMAYDSARQRTVLFGGANALGAASDETWLWDGTGWTLTAPTTRPLARSGHALAYDEARQRVVLFGGFNNGIYFDDTWEWDGISWTERIVSGGPSARNGVALAYDIARQRTVLFGGYDGTSDLGDTWEWDGTAWTKSDASGPPSRHLHALAHDALRGRTVLFGGESNGTPLEDTWEYNGAIWVPRKDVATAACFFEPEYDLVERVLAYRLGSGLEFQPGLLYTVEVVVPEEAGADGLRAFDDAPLETAGSVPLVFDFRTSVLSDPKPDGPTIPMDCTLGVRDVFDLVCARSGCHSTRDRGKNGCPSDQALLDDSQNHFVGCVGVPRMGQELYAANADDAVAGYEALLRTVIGHVAHETEIASTGGVTYENPLRVGVGMPRIDPGKPANSYLMYKLIRKLDNFDPAPGEPPSCTSAWQVALPDGMCLPPSDAESQRLRLWFVRGQPMPFLDNLHINLQQLRDIQAWIAAGVPPEPLFCP